MEKCRSQVLGVAVGILTLAALRFRILQRLSRQPNRLAGVSRSSCHRPGYPSAIGRLIVGSFGDVDLRQTVRSNGTTNALRPSDRATGGVVFVMDVARGHRVLLARLLSRVTRSSSGRAADGVAAM